MSTFWDLKHRLADAINAHDLPEILSFYSPDAVYVGPSGVAEGLDQIAWIYEQVFTAFPDFHAMAWFELGDCENPAVTEWTYTGTHTGPLLLPDGREIGGTGRRITVRATCTAFVEHGRIRTHREYFDQLELYSQLGFGLTRLRPAAPDLSSERNGLPRTEEIRRLAPHNGNVVVKLRRHGRT
ncbi:ester cyclase [Microbispora cellulosiformans]|uniref:Ester cyclase n=1 Tax=Microbispora cellulosiformans TaxID=2614688 RepID=A0A5J5JYQ3_9ACTN|nr:ester cyclase [Microbispora cellulosiformans]KAA9376824.1 ester cyclase [Microbispora cellulosiformans]